MANVDDVLGPVQVHAPDAPQPMVRRAYIDAAREFFDRTGAWRVISPEVFLNDFESGNGRAAYDILVGSDEVVTDARNVTFDGRPLEKRTTTQMVYGSTLSSGRPSEYRIARGVNRLVIAPPPPPDAAQLIGGTFNVQPARDARILPDEIVEQYGECIEYGALRRVLAQPGKQWTDYDGASYFAELYREKLDVWQALAADEGMQGVGRKVRYGGL